MRQVFTEQDLQRFERKVKGTAGAILPCAAPTACRGMTTDRSRPRYRSKLEARYADHLALLMRVGEIEGWRYEPMTLVLTKGDGTGKNRARYRPDFMTWTSAALDAVMVITLIEVKGKFFKNRRDSMTHVKWAAQLYPMYRWRLVEWTDAGWEACDLAALPDEAA